MDPNKIYIDLEKGRLAELALEQIDGRLDEIAVNIHREWENSHADDTDGREQCWYMLKALRELQRSFVRDINGAKIAAKEVELNG